MAASIIGIWFSGANSRPQSARLTLADGRISVCADGVVLAGPLALAQLTVSSRLGSTPRFLRFPDGGSFETADNDGVDRLLAPLRPRHGLLHRLESSLRHVLLGLVVTVVFVWGAVRYGIPMLAEVTAFSLPPELNRQIGDGALELLDSRLLAPSTLAVAEQARLRARFAALLASAATQPLQIEFRDAARSLGANALALPSGTIVFTDQLVRLAERDEELMAVLAHEIGHIERRHALRQVLQASALGLAAMAVTGDVSSVSSAVAAIPVLLTQLGYSRAFEHEADRYGAELLARHGIDTSHLGVMLSRLENSRDCVRHGDCESPAGGWQDYLSTHPPTAERLRRLDAR
ncbi:M48 family metallopeptidase [Azotobacter salinestris]|uniref:M48 family metallopeptidase n=1 Tax=Azotobacter salinestris TaxID=69964 RepID=UPI001266D4B5|nr:M48 family metallopeptidase [Azotobacter salinestris]